MYHFTLAARVKHCKHLVLSDPHAFNSQSFIIFSLIYNANNMHTILFLQAYNAQETKVDLLKQITSLWF